MRAEPPPQRPRAFRPIAAMLPAPCLRPGRDRPTCDTRELPVTAGATQKLPGRLPPNASSKSLDLHSDSDPCPRAPARLPHVVARPAWVIFNLLARPSKTSSPRTAL